jgi:hypothetical protein
MGKELKQMVRMACCWVWQMRRIDNVVWTLEVSILRLWRVRGREVLNKVGATSQYMNIFPECVGKLCLSHVDTTNFVIVANKCEA